VCCRSPSVFFKKFTITQIAKLFEKYDARIALVASSFRLIVLLVV
jgi:hypothetical protein